MASDLRQRWTEAAMRFCADHDAEILCPKNQWWLRCPTCKSEIFILNRYPEEP